MWIAVFAAAEFLLSLPILSPTVPHTVIRLISIPLALLALALMLRPTREAPAYCAIYAAVSLWWELSSTHLDFSIARVAIEVAQMVGLVWLLFRCFFHRFADPLVVGAWALAVLAVTAATAGLMVVAVSNSSLAASENLELFGGSLGAAWRYWWLGNACTFLSLAGPAATLVNLRHRLGMLLRRPGSERRNFIGLTVGLTLTSLFAFPVFDMSWRGFAPDVMLALRLIPVPFAMAMAGPVPRQRRRHRHPHLLLDRGLFGDRPCREDELGPHADAGDADACPPAGHDDCLHGSRRNFPPAAPRTARSGRSERGEVAVHRADEP
ncbi:MAG: hypothetical protein V4502_10825 [Pseudomonadota bacterium]